jgi:hypothetical protein
MPELKNYWHTEESKGILSERTLDQGSAPTAITLFSSPYTPPGLHQAAEGLTHHVSGCNLSCASGSIKTWKITRESLDGARFLTARKAQITHRARIRARHSRENSIGHQNPL